MKKLLILGAGGHGKVCAEIAEEFGYEVTFLDDFSATPFNQYKELRNEYDEALVALGNPILREEWMKKLEETGYKIMSLISSKAVVSKNVEIKEGSVIMAGAIIQSGVKIDRGCIVSANAVVDHDCHIGKYCHINCGAIVASMSSMPDKTKVNYGQVWNEQ